MSAGVINFDSELSRHTELFGRQDVLAKIDGYINTLPCGWVLLLGGPGVGKSAILAHLLKRLGPETPHHIIRRGIEEWDQPEIIVQSLCAWLDRRYPGLRCAEASLQGGLYGALKRISDQELFRFRDKRSMQRLVIVIDGLDEVADDGSGRNPLSRFLPNHLPPGVVIVCASRPTHLQPSWLDQRDGVRPINLDDSDWSISNHEAIRALFEHSAPKFSPPLTPEDIDDAINHANGNLLYAVRLLELLDQQPATRRRTRVIPQGLGGLFEKAWSDIHQLQPAQCKLMKRGLSVLCAAREALPLYLFCEIIESWTTADSEAFLRIMRPILLEERGRSTYRLYHEYFREVITAKLGPTEIRAHEQLLAGTIARWPVEGRDPIRRGYALRYAVTHRLRAGDVHEARRVCLDIGYLDAKCRELGVSAVEQDIEATARAEGDDVPFKLADILTAVSLEAGKLDIDRSALPVLLYNRLLCAGWSPEQMQSALHFPDGLPALRLLTPVNLGTATFRALRGHESAVLACCVIPGGRVVLSASHDRTLRLWTLGFGECVGIMRGHTDEITSCAAMSDGRRAASTSLDGTVKIWDLDTLTEIATLSNEGRWATACAVTPDDRWVVVGSDDGGVRVFDLEKRARAHLMTGHTSFVTACATTVDGRCISASRDGSIRLWNLETGALLRTLPPPESIGETGSDATEESCWVTCVVMLAEDQLIAAYGNGSVILWDLDSDVHRRSRIQEQGRIESCAVTSDGHVLLCGMADGTIALWDLASEKQIDRLAVHSGAVSACAIIPGTRRAISASHDGSLKLLELPSRGSASPCEPPTGAIVACTLTHRGAAVITALEGRTVKRWDLGTGDQRTLAAWEEQITAYALSIDQTHILIGAQTGRLALFDITNGDLIDELKGHTAPVTGCALLGAERVLFTSDDGTLWLWDRKTRTRRMLEQRKEGLLGCVTTPDGAAALAWACSGAVSLWDFKRAVPTSVLFRLRAGLRAATLSSDGRLGVLGFENGMLEVYELPNGRLQRSIQAHTEGVLHCAIPSGGTHVISISKDRTLKAHCIATGAQIAALPHTTCFQCIAVSAERVCARDQTGSVWIIASDCAVMDGGGPACRSPARRSPRSPIGKPAKTATGKASGTRTRKPAPAQRAPSGVRSKSSPFNSLLTVPPREGDGPTARENSTYRSGLALLRDTLSELYPVDSSVRLVAFDIHLDVTRCDLSGSSQNRWQALIIEALHQRIVRKLVDRVRKDYPDDERLERAARNLGIS